jgi:hypothetical protein
MTDAGKRIYRYSVSEDGKSVHVEHAGKAPLNDGETDHEAKAKSLIVSTQRIPEHAFEVKQVDNLDDGVITSDETPNK